MAISNASRYVLVLACALAATAGCASHRPVPYRLPGTVLVPLASAGIADRSADFGALFCSVLGHLGTEGGPWASCGAYVDAPGRADLELPPLPRDFRVLVIPGFLGQCLSREAPAFGDALAHLRERHALDGQLLDVPALGSCEHNGAIIARWLREQPRDDPRRFIVVGYSKGSCDALTALAAHPDVRERVAALITVASPIGGSRLPDRLPQALLRTVSALHVARCERGDGGGIESLRRPVRQAFLRDHPRPLVPTYSLVAVSGRETTSTLLRPFWRALAEFGGDQDAQVIASEGIVPGARFLGVLKGDHWAVGVPFERAANPAVRRLADHNHFPRAALLEAALRLVIDDLRRGPPTSAEGR